MRVVIYGVGAIGGVVAAALARSGADIIGIARGAQLDAIRKRGLTLRTPTARFTARFDCVTSPAEIEFRSDDAILLAMKSQDTPKALDALAAAGVSEQPIFCLQNGVANERMASERFSNIHGITVLLPATFTKPGRVTSFTAPKFGLFEIGCYPVGSDTADEALAARLDAANFAAFVTPDVMAGKYGKLLLNLTNILQAATGSKDATGNLSKRIRAEATAVYQKAGIAWRDVGGDDPRRAELAKFKKPRWTRYVGGSTTQSFLRGLGSVETDYFNGEIVALGEKHGIPVPLNRGLVALGQEMLRRGTRPGSMSLAEVEAILDAS